MYLATDQIKRIHLDSTNACSMKCSLCSRTMHTFSNIRHVTLEDIQKWLPAGTLPNLDTVKYCGNYGDFSNNPHTLDISRYILTIANRITGNTHGSIRPPEWWEEFGSLKPEINWSIDGLEDTCGTYKIGANFNKILSNVRAFIKGGGIAKWNFLVFDYNEHQIGEARKLAKDLGFTKFKLRIGGRFNASQKTNVGPSTLYLKDKKERLGNSLKYDSSYPVSCKFQKQEEILINNFGMVFPCCFISDYAHQGSKGNRDFNKLIKRYGQKFNSLDFHSLFDILNNKWFKQELEESWLPYSKNRLESCSYHCGKKALPNDNSPVFTEKNSQ